MSEFQISLLGIGALVIVAVVAYNKWQDRRIARTTSDSFRSGHEDVLLAKPTRHGQVEADAPLERDASFPKIDDISPDERIRIEPVMSVGAYPTDTPANLADEVSIDHVVFITFSEKVDAEAILGAPELASNPRIRWTEISETGGGWLSIRTGSRCTHIRAALQMINRQGVILERDIASFNGGAFALAERLGGVATAEPVAAALLRAKEFDAFCSDVDVQIAVHLVSRDGVPFAGTKLRGLAEAAGMALAVDGQFSFCNDDGVILYSLANKESTAFHAETMRGMTTRGVSLLLDVPRSTGGIATFRAMVITAQRLSQGLNAAILDDNGNPLGDRAFEMIARQLAVLYSDMEARGVAAGSPTALRLFS